MTRLMQSAHQFGNIANVLTARFVSAHPRLSYLTLYVIMPVGILLAVCACATMVMLPMAWLLGWL